MKPDYTHIFSPEAVTFSLSKKDVRTIYKAIRRPANLNYALGMLLFATVAVGMYFLDLSFLTWILCGGAGLLSVFYLVTTILARLDRKKQLRLCGVKLYNYALHKKTLVVTVKNERSAFNEYAVSIQDVVPFHNDEFILFSHKRKTYAIPRRVLKGNSRFLTLKK